MRVSTERLDQRLSLMISTKTHERLDALERKRHESRSDIVRKAVNAYLTKEENRK